MSTAVNATHDVVLCDAGSNTAASSPAVWTARGAGDASASPSSARALHCSGQRRPLPDRCTLRHALRCLLPSCACEDASAATAAYGACSRLQLAGGRSLRRDGAKTTCIIVVIRVVDLQNVICTDGCGREMRTVPCAGICQALLYICLSQAVIARCPER